MGTENGETGDYCTEPCKLAYVPDSPPSDVAVLSVQKLLLFPKLLSLSLSLCAHSRLFRPCNTCSSKAGGGAAA